MKPSSGLQTAVSLYLHMEERKQASSLGLHLFKGTNPIHRALLVLYWTGTWWSGVDYDERVKGGKRLIFPGLCSWLSCSRESARNKDVYIYISLCIYIYIYTHIYICLCINIYKKNKDIYIYIERERERRGIAGPKLWWSKGVLINMVLVYIQSYKVVILSKDKD